MASTTETGHAKNVANFDDLILYVTGYGAAYNPTKTTIKLSALQTLATNAKNAISNVNASMPAYSNAVAAREDAFKSLSKLVTRLTNALKATDTTQQVHDNAKTFANKIKGVRATAKATEADKVIAKEQGKEIKEISSSQMSFDNRLDNFDKLIKLLTSIPQYAPNETELKVQTLVSVYNDLKVKNQAVITAEVPLSNARISRNNVLYKEKAGINDIVKDVKSYVKSLFGATSPQYKQISTLRFTHPR